METNNSGPVKLSKRETEVLRLIFSGQTNPQIAGKLIITESTVKKHHEKLNHKLQAHNPVQLIENARSMGFL